MTSLSLWARRISWSNGVRSFDDAGREGENLNTITWLGHAAFMLDWAGKTVLLDPWIKGNPSSLLNGPEDIKKADYVLLTHNHRDHGLDDGLEICRRLGAVLVCTTEMARLVDDGIKVISGNLGGEVRAGDFQILFTPAFHVSSVSPCGFVISDGRLTVYNAGDTAFFSDMRFIAAQFSIDWALLPIGSVYTMGPKEASWAVEMLGPRKVVPCHYDTFESIKQDPHLFGRMVEEGSKMGDIKGRLQEVVGRTRDERTEVVVLLPGGSVELA